MVYSKKWNDQNGIRPLFDVESLESPMRSCFQFRDMSVLEHGRSVRRWYSLILDLIVEGRDSGQPIQAPDWLARPMVRESILRLDDSLMELYQVYHDCGKPLCLSLSEDGSRHYPDHARVSRETWLRHSDGSPQALWVADMIGWDMDAHLLRSEGLAEFASRGDRAIGLLVTALAELHSNSEMFGGTGSVGFKVKHKSLCRVGRRVIDLMESSSV